MKKICLLICVIACIIPVFGQIDTLAKYGVYSEYDNARYKTLFGAKIDKSDFVMGELDRATKSIGITYKALPQYFISEEFGLKFPPNNPIELHKTANNAFESKWIHEDGECILFIKCSGPLTSKEDKTIDELPKNILNRINYSIGVGKYFNVAPTNKEMRKLKRKISIWSSKKSKDRKSVV